MISVELAPTKSFGILTDSDFPAIVEHVSLNQSSIEWHEMMEFATLSAVDRLAAGLQAVELGISHRILCHGVEIQALVPSQTTGSLAENDVLAYNSPSGRRYARAIDIINNRAPFEGIPATQERETES